MAISLTSDDHDRRSDLLLGLSDEDVAERRHYIGGSDANTIMGGDLDRILALWEEKTGRREPEDLSDVLPVQIGLWTESLNLAWYERKTGNRVTDRRRQFSSPARDWLRVRPDGMTTVDGERAPIDAKHVGAFNFDFAKVLQRYTPQLYVQMLCTQTTRAVLSVISGTMTYEHQTIERDPIYEAELLAELERFWRCVQDDVPPVEAPVIEPPVPIELMRTVDLSSNNFWCAHEQTYLETEEHAKAHNTAKTELKKLVEDDVREVTGNALRIRRGKSGALSFSKIKKGDK